MNIHDINFLPQKSLTDSTQQPLIRRPRLEFPSFFSVFTRALMGPTLNQMRIHTLFLSDPFHTMLSPLSRSPKPPPSLKFSYQNFVRNSQIANELCLVIVNSWPQNICWPVQIMELLYREEYCETESIALHYFNKYSCDFTQIRQAEKLKFVQRRKNFRFVFLNESAITNYSETCLCLASSRMRHS
jgi:hypothetical protein